LAVAPIYDGAACSEAAKIGGVALQIVRDWIMEFDSHGPEGPTASRREIRPQASGRQGMNFRGRSASDRLIRPPPLPSDRGVAA
jgi:transposase